MSLLSPLFKRARPFFEQNELNWMFCAKFAWNQLSQPGSGEKNEYFKTL